MIKDKTEHFYEYTTLTKKAQDKTTSLFCMDAFDSAFSSGYVLRNRPDGTYEQLKLPVLPPKARVHLHFSVLFSPQWDKFCTFLTAFLATNPF